MKLAGLSWYLALVLLLAAIASSAMTALPGAEGWRSGITIVATFGSVGFGVLGLAFWCIHRRRPKAQLFAHKWVEHAYVLVVAGITVLVLLILG